MVRVVTTLPPRALLAVLRRLEAAAERRRGSRWGPRTLDLDLLAYGARGDLRLRGVELELPHPRLHLRRFVLEPLVELDPELLHPVLDRTVTELLAACRFTSASPDVSP